MYRCVDMCFIYEVVDLLKGISVLQVKECQGNKEKLKWQHIVCYRVSGSLYHRATFLLNKLERLFYLTFWVWFI